MSSFDQHNPVIYLLW